MNTASILIVEDERIIALDLKYRLEVLGYSVAAVVASGEAAICKAGELQPEIVLMDIHLDGSMDGIEAAQTICEQSRIPVVFVTAFAEDETLKRARNCLPFGYIVKPIEMRGLHATIQMALSRRAAEVMAEERVALLGPTKTQRQQPHQHGQTVTRLKLLTPREHEVMQRIAQGHTSRRIADDLNISSRTVETHRQRLMAKLDVSSVAELVRLVISIEVLDNIAD